MQQIAIVNGVYGGIGLEIASTLLSAGFSIILLGGNQDPFLGRSHKSEWGR